MKKLLVSVVALALAGGVAYAADMQQEDASVGLSVPQIIELVGIDMAETVTPGPEDYARDLMVCRVVNDPQMARGTGKIEDNTGNEAATDNAMYDSNDDIGKGFAERTASLEMTIFTNAQDGAALYVHGLQPATQQNILRLEDTYVSICKEKTYIWQNAIEGAFADASSMVVTENKSQTLDDTSGATINSSTATVISNPRMGHEDTLGGSNNDPNANEDEDAEADNPHTHNVDYNIESKPTNKAYSTWLRIHNQAQHLFEVKMSTKAPRLIVINLGIANLARYTEGDYTNTLTFTLMPIVG
ncbi:hypothetical protein KKE26_04820 [bacterium]|nr:hypothetical protein [bacterium]